MDGRSFIIKLSKEKTFCTKDDYEVWLKQPASTVPESKSQELPLDEQPVSETIVQFVDQFTDLDHSITSEQLQKFVTSLQATSSTIQAATLYSFFSEIEKFLATVGDEVNAFRKYINENVSHLDTISYSEPIKHEKIYERFLIFYQLWHEFSSTKRFADIPIFGHRARLYFGNIQDQVPFILNMLNLIGKLTNINSDLLVKIDLGQPFQALTQPISKLRNFARYKIKSEVTNAKLGIKANHRFFMIDHVNKKNPDRPDATLLAVDKDKRKLMFIRHHEKTTSSRLPNPWILASKIARRVSAKHFSSERLITNENVASRKLAGYVIPVYDVGKDLRKHKKILPGLGIIDEVCRFIGENDYQTENLGISTSDLSKAYFTKIDFDNCRINESSEQFSVITNYKDTVYKTRIVDDKLYQLERLTTRFKLVLFKDELLEIDIQKCLFSEENKKDALKMLTDSRRLERNLLLEDKSVELAAIMQNPLPIYKDILTYFIQHDSKHLTAKECQKIVASVQNELKTLLSLVPQVDKDKLIREIDKVTTEELANLTANVKTGEVKETKDETLTDIKPKL